VYRRDLHDATAAALRCDDADHLDLLLANRHV
jgi:hypothetical protein